MAISWSGLYWRLGLASLSAMGGAIATSGNCVLAQITPDGTLPNNSIVTPQGNTSLIEGGTQAGSNLFHSFEQFSVPTGGEASFNNALDIQNIISRVTGSSISNIDGLLRANGTANLFLLNPNGIDFGSNARLSIGGSFVGSTASSLNFADGTQFSTTAPTTTPLLTVSVPIGLQYGGNAGSIRVQGNGQGIRTTTNLIDTTVGLRVEPNQTLALVGGDVALEGGTLKTAGGRIELGSVAGSGLVGMAPTDSGWAFGYSGVPTFGNVRLSGAAAVDASGEGGGDIQVRGSRVTLTGGSQIEASTLGAEPGGTLSVTASEAVEVIGESADGNYSGLFAVVYPETAGAGGNLTIETGRLSVSDGAQVSTSTFGAGNAGDLTVRATEVELSGTTDGQFSSGLFAQVDAEEATGAGGNLTIETGRLSVSDGAQVSSSTFGIGDAGDLTVRASDSVEVSGGSGLFAVNLEAQGDGGDLTIETGRLSIRNGAAVSTYTSGSGNAGTLRVQASDLVEVLGTGEDGGTSYLNANVYEGGTGNGGDLTIETRNLIVRSSQVGASTFGVGNAGNLTVRASDSVELSGKVFSGNIGNPGGLFSQVNITGEGRGSNLTIETRRLSVSEGSRVQVATFGQGDAGNMFIRASEVDVFETANANSFPAGIFAGVQIDTDEPPEIPPRGFGGNLTIETDRLRVRDGGRVSTTTEGEGNAGTLQIRASESVEVVGTSPNGIFTSEISAAATPISTGSGGSLSIETGQMTVRDGAEVAVNNQGSGNAGALRVEAGEILLENLGQMRASTASGEGGNIDLQVQDFILMRQNSLISAEAGGTGNGGNITINAPFIVAVPSENSDIVANAFQGQGGDINITTQRIYGLEYRDQLTEESDINASSQFGVSGTVAINTPDVDPSQGLVVLPTELVDASNQIATGCPADGENKFIITGRGGLPPNPNEPLSGDNVLTEWSTLDSDAENPSSTAPATNPTKESAITQIVEANGWMINNKGEVVLTAQAPTATLDIPWLPSSDCHAPEPES